MDIHKEFLEYIDYWIKSHKRVKYHGLNNFKRKGCKYWEQLIS